jgi:hypothetical protein
MNLRPHAFKATEVGADQGHELVGREGGRGAGIHRGSHSFRRIYLHHGHHFRPWTCVVEAQAGDMQRSDALFPILLAILFVVMAITFHSLSIG